MVMTWSLATSGGRHLRSMAVTTKLALQSAVKAVHQYACVATRSGAAAGAGVWFPTAHVDGTSLPSIGISTDPTRVSGSEVVATVGHGGNSATWISGLFVPGLSVVGLSVAENANWH